MEFEGVRESADSHIVNIHFQQHGLRKTQTFIAQGALINSEQISEMKNEMSCKTELKFDYLNKVESREEKLTETTGYHQIQPVV